MKGNGEGYLHGSPGKVTWSTQGHDGGGGVTDVPIVKVKDITEADDNLPKEVVGEDAVMVPH